MSAFDLVLWTFGIATSTDPGEPPLAHSAVAGEKKKSTFSIPICITNTSDHQMQAAK